MFDYDIVIFRDDAHTYFLLHSVLWIRLNFDLDTFNFDLDPFNFDLDPFNFDLDQFNFDLDQLKL